MKITCPSCGALSCYHHCNSCGKSIFWKKDEYADKWKMYESGTDIVHYGCMKNGVKKWVNIKQKDEYIIDQYHTYYRYSGPVFQCSNCLHKDDLARMLEHHQKDKQCEAILMKKLFKEPMTVKIDRINSKLEAWL